MVIFGVFQSLENEEKIQDISEGMWPRTFRRQQSVDLLLSENLMTLLLLLCRWVDITILSSVCSVSTPSTINWPRKNQCRQCSLPSHTNTSCSHPMSENVLPKIQNVRLETCCLTEEIIGAQHLFFSHSG